MNKERNDDIPLKNIPMYGLVAAGFITAFALGKPHLINLLEQVSPNSILTQVGGMNLEIPIRENIKPVIDAALVVVIAPMSAIAALKIIDSTLYRK